MKFKLRILSVIFLCATMMFAFAACNRDEPNGNQVEPVGNLSAEQVAFVRQSYFSGLSNVKESEINNIKILYDLGTYNDNITVLLRFSRDGEDVPCVVVPLYVNGIFITDLNDPSYNIVVCTPKGVCFNLQAAFDAELISKSDLTQISERAESRWNY